MVIIKQFIIIIITITITITIIIIIIIIIIIVIIIIIIIIIIIVIIIIIIIKYSEPCKSLWTNPRTYTQIHTSTLIQGGVDGTPPRSFWYVAVCWNNFTFNGEPLILLLLNINKHLVRSLGATGALEIEPLDVHANSNPHRGTGGGDGTPTP